MGYRSIQNIGALFPKFYSTQKNYLTSQLLNQNTVVRAIKKVIG